MKTHIEKLKKLHACHEAVEWAEQFKTMQEAWDKCVRGDWMLWLLGKLSGDPDSDSRKELVMIACKCARLALKYVPKDEKRPLKSIQTAEKWTLGKATLPQVRDAVAAAYAAAYAAVADAVAAAAYAAVAVAAVADAVADADVADAVADADAAAYAAVAVAAVADAVADADAVARSKTLKKCANIVRKYHPTI